MNVLLPTLIVLSSLDASHAMFYNKTDPLPDLQDYGSPLLYLPYFNSSTSNAMNSGVFTLKRQFSIFNFTSTCIGALVKTWTVLNSTVDSWKAVGVIGGNCLSDLSGQVGGFIPYTSGNNYKNLIAKLGPVTQLSFNYFNDVKPNKYLNVSINAIQFGSTKVFDALVVEFNFTIGSIKSSAKFFDFAEASDLVATKDVKNAPSVIAITSLTSGGILDDFPRINYGNKIN